MTYNFFSYMGGKHYMLKHILKLIPPHRIYVEPFLGSGKVFFAKKNSKIEVLNDFDYKISNLFYVVAFKFEEFYQKINSLVYSRALLKQFREEIKTNANLTQPLGNVDFAVKTYFLFNSSFSSNGTTLSYSYQDNRAKTFFNKIQNLDFIHNRLKNAIIENQDFEIVINKYSKFEDAFIYLDPPYFNKEFYYNVNFTLQDHIRLLQILKNSKAKWMISNYDNDLYNKELKDYYKISIKAYKHSYGITGFSKLKTRPEEYEIIWTNYPIYAQSTEINSAVNQEINLFEKTF